MSSGVLRIHAASGSFLKEEGRKQMTHLQNLAKTLKTLTYDEMMVVAKFLADCVEEDGGLKKFNQDYFAHLLSDFSENIQQGVITD